MPIEFISEKKLTFLTETLSWHSDLVRIHNNGAITFHFVAISKSAVTPKDLIRSYHEFRLQISLNMQGIVSRVFEMWNAFLPEYALSCGGLDKAFDHAELYDVVDFDFEIDGKRTAPKDIYKRGQVGALRCLAGISRMSAVFESYSAESLAKFCAADLGGRDDELWVPNAERLIRHHPEHLSDEAKRMFWHDVITGIDVQSAERATLNLLVFWARRLRAKFLDELTISDIERSEGVIMRSLLREIASCTDLYHELPSFSRLTGSSFFGKLLGTIESIRETRQIQSEVSESISQALEIANSIFAERIAAASQRTNQESLEIARSSKTVAVAAAFAALVALVVAVLQLYVAIYPPVGAAATGTSPSVSNFSDPHECALTPAAASVSAVVSSDNGAASVPSAKVIERKSRE